MPRRSLRTAAVAVGAGALAVPFLMAPANAAPSTPSPSGRTTLSGTHPQWATPSREKGAPSASAAVTFRAVLRLRNAAAAEKLAYAVSDPASASYQKFLTASEFNAHYGATDSSVKTVRSYLSEQGFTVTSVAPGNRWVEATGTVARVDKAFSTTLKTYRYSGHTLRSPSVAASIPASVQPDIMTITGLDQAGTLVRPANTRVQPDGVTGKAAPAAKPAPGECSNYWDQHEQTTPAAYGGKTSYPTYICGYIGDQLQTAYGVKSAIVGGRTGTGVTVGIIDAYGSPTALSDLKRYSGDTGLAAPKPGQYQQKLFTPFNQQANCGGEAGWNGEQTLDIEAVHAMAEGAHIFYFGAKNCGDGIDKALNYAIQQDKVDMVSNSYGYNTEDLPASQINATHAMFVQAAAQGIGIYFSSGDSGDDLAAAGSIQPSYSASDPMVTAVGGTSLAIDGAGNRLFETGWGTALDRVLPDYSDFSTSLPGAFLFGAGGGVSTLFAQPAYQKHVVPDSVAKMFSSKKMRAVPDVAALADPYTGFLVGQTENGVYGTYGIGGTSLACPVFAGIQALASQGLKHRIGFANPVLYRLAGSRAYHDVAPQRSPVAVTNPSGSYLVTFDKDSSLYTAKGYDQVTGVGSPNGEKFLYGERRVARH